MLMKLFRIFHICYFHFNMKMQRVHILKCIHKGWPQRTSGNRWAYLVSFSEMSAEYNSSPRKAKRDWDLKTFVIYDLSKDCVTEMPPPMEFVHKSSPWNCSPSNNIQNINWFLKYLFSLHTSIVYFAMTMCYRTLLCSLIWNNLRLISPDCVRH